MRIWRCNYCFSHFRSNLIYSLVYIFYFFYISYRLFINHWIHCSYRVYFYIVIKVYNTFNLIYRFIFQYGRKNITFIKSATYKKIFPVIFYLRLRYGRSTRVKIFSMSKWHQFIQIFDSSLIFSKNYYIWRS